MWKKFGSENKWSLNGLLKLPEKNRLLIFLLLGVLLVVIAMPSPQQNEGESSGSGETAPSGTTDAYENYEALLEQKLKAALEQVEGVGKLNVMITFRTTGERVVEKDMQSSSQTVEEEDGEGGMRTTTDQSVNQTSVYEDASDGGQNPYVSKEITPEVEGILIIADGGDNPVVVQDITEAAQALFGIDAHKIKIMKRDDS